MTFNAIIVLIYAIIVLLGGLAGYLFANSLPSLIAGSLFGATLFACGMGLFKKSVIAFFTAMGTSGILTLFFAYRFWATGKMMPAGMMGILSLFVFLQLLTTKATRNSTLNP